MLPGKDDGVCQVPTLLRHAYIPLSFFRPVACLETGGVLGFAGELDITGQVPPLAMLFVRPGKVRSRLTNPLVIVPKVESSSRRSYGERDGALGSVGHGPRLVSESQILEKSKFLVGLAT